MRLPAVSRGDLPIKLPINRIERCEVMGMPRSKQWIFDHADELAQRYEEYEFKPEDERDLAEYLLRRAAIAQARNERDFIYAVEKAREAGWSWRRIGEELGMSAQAVHQRHGRSA